LKQNRVFLLVLGVLATGALLGAIVGIEMSETTDLPGKNTVDVGDLQLVVNSVERASRQCERDESSPLSGRTAGASRERLDRVYLRVTLKNRSDRPHVLDPEEFRLQPFYGGSRSSRRESLTVTTLRPRETLHSVLWFDVPEGASGLQLVWTREGREVHFPVAEDTSGQVHGDPDRFAHGRDEVSSSAVPSRRDPKLRAQGC
jgi:uncharacterized protein DUF4352